MISIVILSLSQLALAYCVYKLKIHFDRLNRSVDIECLRDELFPLRDNFEDFHQEELYMMDYVEEEEWYRNEPGMWTNPSVRRCCSLRDAYECTKWAWAQAYSQVTVTEDPRAEPVEALSVDELMVAWPGWKDVK